jgi:hypothetical protein
MADHAEMAGSENGNDAAGVFGTWQGAQLGFFRVTLTRLPAPDAEFRQRCGRLRSKMWKRHAKTHFASCDTPVDLLRISPAKAGAPTVSVNDPFKDYG